MPTAYKGGDMYKTIMVPTEGTGFDREAIRVALRLATQTDATIHLVRVMKTSPLTGVSPGPDGVAMVAEAVGLTRDRELSALYMLAAECRDLTTATIVTALEEGPVADVLEGYAARVSADLIVIASHGRHGFARLSMGSVTDSLVRNVHLPVLVVKPEPSYLNPRATERFGQVIIPLDGSTLAEQILGPAARFAQLEQSEIVLLQVMSAQDQDAGADLSRAWWEDGLPLAHAYLNRVAARLRSRGLAVSSDIIIGTSVAEAIASFARSRRAQLVAIATHGRSGLKRALRGSVADELMRNAAISLLVMHPKRQAEVGLEAGSGELMAAR
jgi:nucleotide-binding universal stress UspA family protein